MKDFINKAIALHNKKCESRWCDEKHIELYEIATCDKGYKVVLAIGKYDKTTYKVLISDGEVFIEDVILGEPQAELSLLDVEELIEKVIALQLFPRRRIGAELRALRISRGLSVRALAELAGIGYAHIARIEAGKYNLRVDTVAKIAEALGARLEIVKNDE